MAEHRFSWAAYDDLLTHQQLQARDIWADANQVGNRAWYFLDRDGNVLTLVAFASGVDAICCVTITDCDPAREEVTMPSDKTIQELDEAAEKAACGEVTFAGMALGAGAMGAMPIWWRKLVAFVSGAGMAVALLAGDPVEAAPRCMPMSLLVKELTTKYGEQHVGAATYQSDGSWRFLYANVRSFISVQPTTYTIFDLRSGGMACIVETGKNVPDWVIAAALGRGVA